jgi:hypothetical protein
MLTIEYRSTLGVSLWDVVQEGVTLITCRDYSEALQAMQYLDACDGA